MTMIIAVPTSALVLNWIATMYKGRINFSTPMLWFLGYIAVFSIGGMSGVMLAAPPADFQLHNSLFLGSTLSLNGNRRRVIWCVLRHKLLVS